MLEYIFYQPFALLFVRDGSYQMATDAKLLAVTKSEEDLIGFARKLGHRSKYGFLWQRALVLFLKLLHSLRFG